MKYGKFETAEELLKAYNELEKAFTQKCQELAELKVDYDELFEDYQDLGKYVVQDGDELDALKAKIKNGTLVELPKYGDTYWYIYSGGVPEAVIVTRIEVEINQSETRIYAYGRACGGLIGVIMFPTYEQAEARLKELRKEK